MKKKPRQMSADEYCGSVIHTHTWFSTEEVLPPSNVSVIVETKESFSNQCAYYVDNKTIENTVSGAVFIDKNNRLHRVNDGIEEGFYVELVNGGPHPVFKEISVTRWTDLPSMGVDAEILNVSLYLRRYFKQVGRNDEAVKRIFRDVLAIYFEKPEDGVHGK